MKTRPVFRAFTLVEIIVVVAIIAIVASILFPVISRAKRQAKVADGWSRMKQTSLALAIYSQDNDDRLPQISTARIVVPKAVQCHPLDKWVPECKVRIEDFMLGSWGYAPADPDPAPNAPKSTWIVNIFAAQEPPTPTYLYRTPFDAPCTLSETCFVQERIECMGEDSALRVVKRAYRPKFSTGPYMIFDWNTAFDLCRGAVSESN